MVGSRFKYTSIDAEKKEKIEIQELIGAQRKNKIEEVIVEEVKE